jgi:hypothetical protein
MTYLDLLNDFASENQWIFFMKLEQGLPPCRSSNLFKRAAAVFKKCDQQEICLQNQTSNLTIV